MAKEHKEGSLSQSPCCSLGKGTGNVTSHSVTLGYAGATEPAQVLARYPLELEPRLKGGRCEYCESHSCSWWSHVKSSARRLGCVSERTPSPSVCPQTPSREMCCRLSSLRMKPPFRSARKSVLELKVLGFFMYFFKCVQLAFQDRS